MDRRRLIIGGSLIVLVFGLILIGFTEGGIFNPVIPYRTEVPVPGAIGRYRPDLAYRDLTREGPAVGLVLLAVGAGGLIYGWAVKSPQ
jgi:hypothetical protein